VAIVEVFVAKSEGFVAVASGFMAIAEVLSLRIIALGMKCFPFIG